MKKKPILYSAIMLLIIVEVILIALVYNKIGDEKLPEQFVRLFFQLILIVLILIRKSNIALFILSGYYIISGLYVLYMINKPDSIELLFGFYNIIIGMVLYFHDWIESKLKLNKYT